MSRFVKVLGVKNFSGENNLSASFLIDTKPDNNRNPYFILIVKDNETKFESVFDICLNIDNDRIPINWMKL